MANIFDKLLLLLYIFTCICIIFCFFLSIPCAINDLRLHITACVRNCVALKDEIQKKLDKMQEPPPVKQVKPLPKPDDAPRKKRDGRRYVAIEYSTMLYHYCFIFIQKILAKLLESLVLVQNFHARLFVYLLYAKFITTRK